MALQVKAYPARSGNMSSKPGATQWREVLSSSHTYTHIHITHRKKNLKNKKGNWSGLQNRKEHRTKM